MENKTCKECQHYLQHYTIINGKVRMVYCGHCVNFSRKRKMPDEKICELFEAGTPVKEEMVSKEFLTKALLQRVLDMELFPESAK